MKAIKHRRKCSLPVILILFIALASIGSIGTANATLLTDADINHLALIETAAMTTGMVIQSFGLSVGESLMYTGTFDSSGWSLSLIGIYSGMDVNLSFTGTFDGISNSGTFASTGSIDAFSWGGSGSWFFTGTGLTTSLIDWDSEATIIGVSGPKGKPDGHSKVTTEEKIVGDYIEINSKRDILRTMDNVVVFRDKGKDYHLIPLPVEPPPPEPQDGMDLWRASDIQLDGVYHADSGTLSGTVSVVPEPTAFVLLSTGLLGLLICTRKRWKKSA